jgi:DNA replication protein DnaC
VERDEREQLEHERELELGQRRYNRLTHRYPNMWHYSPDWTVHDEHVDAALEAINEWHTSDSTGCNLYLWGDVGVGKSYLAWLQIRDYLLRGYNEADFVNVPLMFADLRRGYTNQDFTAERRLEELAEMPLICLDDLGAERVTDWTADKLHQLVERRHQQEWSTIITSNYPPSALAARLGHHDDITGRRIVSRLTQWCVIHHMTGVDRRLNAA